MRLSFRFATIRDLQQYFEWANDPIVRQSSFQTKEIQLEQHSAWFEKKLLDRNCFMYFFEAEKMPAGQVRIECGNTETVIGISVAPEFRGKGLASEMLQIACNDFLSKRKQETITAYIKEENRKSLSAFLKAGFAEREQLAVDGSIRYKLIRTF